MATPTTIATSIPESLRPTEAAVDGQHAIFLYPSGAPVINNIDTIQVTYDTIWPAANLTLTCEIEPRRRLFSTATYDLVGKDGSIEVIPTEAEPEISKFPTRCRMLLRDANDESNVYTGGAFTLTSTQGAPSFYALSQTHLVTPTSTQFTAEPTANATGVDGMSISSSMPRLGNESSSASPADTDNPASSALGAGARAGIIVSIIVGVLGLAIAMVFCMRNRRKVRKFLTRSSEGDGIQGKQISEKPPVSFSTENSNRSSTESPTTSRSSEDWRKFFGNATGRPVEK